MELLYLKGAIIISEKRRDKKHRILRNGESQRADGRYAYKYIGSDGKPHFAYSWKLEKTDLLPSGKRDCEALREQEKRITAELEKGLSKKDFSDLSVCDLVERYISTHKSLRKSTIDNYRTALNVLKQYPLSDKKISYVTTSDLKAYALAISQTRNYGTTSTYLEVIKAAFAEAVEDNLLDRSPFSFKLSKLLVNDVVPKTAIKQTDETDFFDFCNTDKFASKNKDAVIILFGTGIRISELCGLTLNDVDMEKKVVHIRHQLYKKSGKIDLVPPKSKASIRTIPMSKEVYDAFSRAIANRACVKNPEYSDFIFLTNRGTPTCAADWDHWFNRALRKMNQEREGKNLSFTPHSCRHTFCSSMVLKGMNLKVLQRIAGHSNFNITANRYVHVDEEEDILREFEKVTS